MANKIPFNDIETKLDRTIRYMELMSGLWDIRRKLRNEFPDKFYESNKSYAQKMLDAGLINSKE